MISECLSKDKLFMPKSQLGTGVPREISAYRRQVINGKEKTGINKWSLMVLKNGGTF
jgi:hypothetical protein